MRVHQILVGVLVAATPFALAGPAGATGASTIVVPCAGGGAALSAAISTANAAAQPTVIRLASGCTYLVTEEDDFADGGGLPAITADVAITAPGAAATIARPASAPTFSLVNVNAGGTLHLTNVVVTGGLARSGFVGGGMGVANGATAVLDRVRVTGNTARSTSRPYAFGGGIYNNGSLTLIDCRVDNNGVIVTATDGLAVGGGIVSEGFGPGVHATLTVQSSLIDSNVAVAKVGEQPGAVGGGIATLGNATTTLTDSTVASNRVTSAGAGSAALGAGLFDNLSFFSGFARTSSTLIGSTLVSNLGDAAGGFAGGEGLYSAVGDHSRIDHASSVLGNVARAPGGSATAGGLFEEAPGLIRVSSAAVVSGNRP